MRGWFSRLKKESTCILELLAAGLTRGNRRDLCWFENVTAVHALWGYWSKGNTPVWPWPNIWMRAVFLLQPGLLCPGLGCHDLCIGALLLGTASLCHGQQTSRGISMLATVWSSHSFIGNAVLGVVQIFGVHC